MKNEKTKQPKRIVDTHTHTHVLLNKIKAFANYVIARRGLAANSKSTHRSNLTHLRTSDRLLRFFNIFRTTNPMSRNDVVKSTSHHSLLTIHSFKPAFTLVEMMLSLIIIGVVAAMILPRLITSLNTMAWNKSVNEFEAKMDAATQNMKLNGVLNTTYSSNADFLNTFKKYYKITKVCSTVADCFESTFTNSDKTTVKITALTQGSNLGLLGTNGKAASTVGVQFINGITAIFAYDLDTCSAKSYLDPYQVSKADEPQAHLESTDVGYTRVGSASTKCLYIVYDLNGSKGPNTVNKDIRTFNASISPTPECTGVKYKDLCIDLVDTQPAVTINSYANSANWQILKGIFPSITPMTYNASNDGWADAMYSCYFKGTPGTWRLPTCSEAWYFAPGTSDKTAVNQLLAANHGTALFSSGSYYYTSQLQAGGVACSVYYATYGTDPGVICKYGRSNPYPSRCVHS